MAKRRPQFGLFISRILDALCMTSDVKTSSSGEKVLQSSHFGRVARLTSGALYKREAGTKIDFVKDDW
jgi:hypothetical protein